MDVVGIVSALIALIAAGAAFWQAAEARRARIDSQTAARTAEATAVALREIADTTLASRQETLDAPWRLTWEGWDEYALTNESPATMRGVTIDSTDPESLSRVTEFPCDLPAKAQRRFDIIPGTTEANLITVTWIAPDGQTQTWETQLPEPR